MSKTDREMRGSAMPKQKAVLRYCCCPLSKATMLNVGPDLVQTREPIWDACTRREHNALKKEMRNVLENTKEISGTEVTYRKVPCPC
jgi:DNA-binding FadR family transcriptional regulator